MPGWKKNDTLIFFRLPDRSLTPSGLRFASCAEVRQFAWLLLHGHTFKEVGSVAAGADCAMPVRHAVVQRSAAAC